MSTSNEEQQHATGVLSGQIKAFKQQRDKYPEGSSQWTAFDNMMWEEEKRLVQNALDFDRPLAAAIIKAFDLKTRKR